MTLTAVGGVLTTVGGVLGVLGAPTVLLKGFNVPGEVDTGTSLTAQQEMALIASTGADAVRLSLYWQNVEPTTKGVFDWKYSDRTFDAATAAGLRVLWVVSRTPDWARTGTDRYSYADNPADYGDFLAAAAARYHSRGVRPPAWELWNEQNLDVHVDDVNDITGYVAIASAGYAGVKGRAPTATVILGALLRGGHEYASRPQFVKLDTRWLEEFYAVGGGPGVTHDAMGYHPYSYPFDPADLTPTGADEGPNLVGNPGLEANATSWFGSRATLTRVATPVHGGTGALAVTADGTGTYGGGTFSVPAAPGEYFHDFCWIYSPTTSREFTIRVDYYDAAGASVGSTIGDIFNTRVGVWIKVGSRGVAPANTAKAAFGFISSTTPPAGEVVYIDDVGLYRASSERHGFNRIDQVRAMMLAHGDDSPMWLTEYGQHTGGTDSVTDTQQASFLVHAIDRTATFDYVHALFLYQSRNAGTDGVRESTFGIVNQDYTARPAYAAVTAAWRGPGMALPPAALFADGFEDEGASFNFHWDNTALTAGLAVETAAPISGTKSMRYTHDGVRTGNGLVQKTIPARTGPTYAKVVIDLKTLVADNANSLHRLFQFNGPFANLEFGHGGVPTDGYMFKGNGAFSGTTGFTLTQGQRLVVEMYYEAGTGANGKAAWWVNGVQISSTTTHTMTQAVTGLKVGNNFANQGGLGSGTVFLFDDVVISSERIAP